MDRHCSHCGQEVMFGEWYMLYDNIWKQANKGKHSGYMHLACVAKVLGRKLTVHDFNWDMPVNDWIKRIGVWYGI